MNGKVERMGAEEPMIEVVGLKKSFGPLDVLKDINLSVPRGHVVAMIGPSGSGKSTLLRSLNLLSLPDAGCITIGGRRMDFPRAGLPCATGTLRPSVPIPGWCFRTSICSRI